MSGVFELKYYDERRLRRELEAGKSVVSGGIELPRRNEAYSEAAVGKPLFIIWAPTYMY